MLFRKVLAVGLIVAGVLAGGCHRSDSPLTPEPKGAPSKPEVAVKPSLPPAVETPNPWFALEPWQRTITRQEFERKLERLYDPFDAMRAYMQITDERVIFYLSPKIKDVPVYTLEFAPDAEHRAPLAKVFRTPAEIRALPKPEGKPLHDLRIAIDPGHIGGKWAQVENRSTRYRKSAPVNEGDLNVITALLLKKQLSDLGATVFLVRETTDPVTPFRPSDFVDEAVQVLLDKNPKIAAKLQGKSFAEKKAYFGKKKVQDVADFLFYRGSEIPERGHKIRTNFKPDITITLYLNATPGSGRSRLTPINRNIFFVHGSYTKDEVADLNQRRQLVTKLLEDGNDIEAEVGAAIADAFKEKTGFKPVMYGDSKTTRMVVPGNLYVVARNLAANRNYSGPVVCTEPYFMNQVVTYRRLLAGDYEGTRLFDGKPYTSIFRDYAEALTAGLLRAYGPPIPVVVPAPDVVSTSVH